ncbi:SDR family NAD(P)-dependent oxidoreductase [Corynebacterium glutamicum]|uniref:SDR family NAD(P)-dependent oxidoreductase n=1 Tax=Corynebacterium glutamicum TaxID=1718 RepID=UPI001B8C1A6B|nr:SDR family NAD(P)-dependent oxidoreductase [Corynebacterium glutamicum]
MTLGPQLKGKTAVVTGGASGIGAAIVSLFAQHGAKVAIADLDFDNAKLVAERCVAEGGVAKAWSLNVTDAQATSLLMSEVAEEFGSIDILVTAAGILDQQDFLEMSEETFDRTIAIDLKGVFLAGRYAAPYMVKQGSGRIINIASQTAIKGAVSLSHYVAAKSGVIGMTKSMALELAQYGILVNAIAPGPIETPLFDGITQEWRNAKKKELPLGRFGRAEEVAPTALLLASSPGGDIYTGQTLGPNSGDVMP